MPDIVRRLGLDYDEYRSYVLAHAIACEGGCGTIHRALSWSNWLKRWGIAARALNDPALAFLFERWCRAGSPGTYSGWLRQQGVIADLDDPFAFSHEHAEHRMRPDAPLPLSAVNNRTWDDDRWHRIGDNEAEDHWMRYAHPIVPADGRTPHRPSRRDTSRPRRVGILTAKPRLPRPPTA
jgi:hypothetical protein